MCHHMQLFFMCAPNLNGQAYMACAGSGEVVELGFDLSFYSRAISPAPEWKKNFLGCVPHDNGFWEISLSICRITVMLAASLEKKNTTSQSVL